MSLSKDQLAGELSKKALSLDEKVKFLDFAKGNPNFGCKKLAEIFKIGKTASANILKEEKSIRSQHENLPYETVNFKDPFLLYFR